MAKNETRKKNKEYRKNTKESHVLSSTATQLATRGSDVKVKLLLSYTVAVVTMAT